MPWVSAQRLGKERASLGSSHEDMPGSQIGPGDRKVEQMALKRRPAPPPHFRFGYRRQPIDWRALHGIDIQRMVSCSA